MYKINNTVNNDYNVIKWVTGSGNESWCHEIEDLYWRMNPRATKAEQKRLGMDGLVWYKGAHLGFAFTEKNATHLLLKHGWKALIPDSHKEQWYGKWLVERLNKGLYLMLKDDRSVLNGAHQYWINYALRQLWGEYPNRPIKANSAVWIAYPILFDYWANTDELKDIWEGSVYWHEIENDVIFWESMDPYGHIGTWDQIRAHYMERSYRVAYDIYAKVKRLPNLFTKNN